MDDVPCLKITVHKSGVLEKTLSYAGWLISYLIGIGFLKEIEPKEKLAEMCCGRMHVKDVISPVPIKPEPWGAWRELSSVGSEF